MRNNQKTLHSAVVWYTRFHSDQEQNPEYKPPLLTGKKANVVREENSLWKTVKISHKGKIAAGTGAAQLSSIAQALETTAARMFFTTYSNTGLSLTTLLFLSKLPMKFPMENARK